MSTEDSIRPGVRDPAQDLPARQSIPFLKSDEEQIAKIRRQLEALFRELRLVQDVMVVCGVVSESVGSDLDAEVEHVLRRCGSERMSSVLKTLTQIIERFGGRTELSESRSDHS
jgi:hypothetical protein